MAQPITYRPNTIHVTAAQTQAANGESLVAAINTLPVWNRTLLFATIQNALGLAIPNAGVRIHQLASSGTPLASANLIATVFTDVAGEFGVSLPVLTAPAVYATEAFIGIN